MNTYDLAEYIIENSHDDRDAKIVAKAYRKLVEAIKNIREFNSMIPLHTEDEHAIHFSQMVENWCKQALEQE